MQFKKLILIFDLLEDLIKISRLKIKVINIDFLSCIDLQGVPQLELHL